MSPIPSPSGMFSPRKGTRSERPVSEMGPLSLPHPQPERNTGRRPQHASTIADDNGCCSSISRTSGSMAQYVGDNADQFKVKYGNISKASGRGDPAQLLVIGERSKGGGKTFFGEPALSTSTISWQAESQTGQGDHQHPRGRQADAVRARSYVHSPALASLDALRAVPEVAICEAKLVFFFDRRNLSSSKTSRRPLEDKIEQVCGFINPIQGGRRGTSSRKTPRYSRRRSWSAWKPRPSMPCGLHAARPRRREGCRRDLRQNPKLDTTKAILELRRGARPSCPCRNEKGVPAMVERAWLVPPHSSPHALQPARDNRHRQGVGIFGSLRKDASIARIGLRD